MQPKKSPPAQSFPAALVALRHLHGDNQADFARLLGVSVRTVARWESGASEPLTVARAQLLDFAASLPGRTGHAVIRALEPTSEALIEPPAPKPPAEDRKRELDAALYAVAEELDIGAASLRRAIDRMLATIADLRIDVAEAREALGARPASEPSRGTPRAPAPTRRSPP